jgi:Ca2+-binding RTX toxin-like protein
MKSEMSLTPLALIGGAGADTLNGGAGADTLDGRVDAATDLMQGGADGDIYLFGRGSGAETITEGGDAGSTDILRLGEEIAASMARIESRRWRYGDNASANVEWRVAA